MLSSTALALILGGSVNAGAKVLSEANKYGLNAQQNQYALDQLAAKHGYSMEEMEKQYALAYQNAVGLANLNNSAQLNLANVHAQNALAQQVQQQAFDSMKYQVAVDDMKKAGINPGAMSQGMESPAVAGASGKVTPVGYSSALDTSNADINSALKILAHRNKGAFGRALSDSQKATKKTVMRSI